VRQCKVRTVFSRVRTVPDSGLRLSPAPFAAGGAA